MRSTFAQWRERVERVKASRVQRKAKRHAEKEQRQRRRRLVVDALCAWKDLVALHHRMQRKVWNTLCQLVLRRQQRQLLQGHLLMYVRRRRCRQWVRYISALKCTALQAHSCMVALERIFRREWAAWPKALRLEIWGPNDPSVVKVLVNNFLKFRDEALSSRAAVVQHQRLQHAWGALGCVKWPRHTHWPRDLVFRLLVELPHCWFSMQTVLAHSMDELQRSASLLGAQVPAQTIMRRWLCAPRGCPDVFNMQRQAETGHKYDMVQRVHVELTRRWRVKMDMELHAVWRDVTYELHQFLPATLVLRSAE